MRLTRATGALCAALFLCGALSAGTVAEPVGSKPDADPKYDKTGLLNGLRAGGYVIYFRHAATEKDFADQVSAKMGDCSTQRMLSEGGWKQARGIGAAIAELKIPIGSVVSSEYCRAWQTADLAFGRHEKNKALNFEPAEDYTDAQMAAMRERVMPLVTAVPPKGTNVIIVGHDDPFEAVSGIYPEPQGVAYVLAPDGKAFKILARLTAEQWAGLK
jgi:phosphohistidine phosphatase SixA